MMKHLDSISKTRAEILDNGTTCEEITLDYLDRIEALDPDIKAFITYSRDHAVRQARLQDSQIRRNAVGRLCGVTIAVKDNIVTKGMATSCGSRMLRDWVPPYDATVIERVVSEGGIVVGKTNMDEFGMGTTTKNSHFGPTKNPVDHTRVAGGSSGGSAAAVKAGMALVSLGEDTGGSIRCPASYCGVTGLKPSYGLVSRYGLVAYAHSFDQIGPVGSSAEDCATLLDVIAGHDPMDGTTREAGHPSFTSSLKAGVRGLSIGLPREFFKGGTTTQVAEAVRDAVSVLESLGARCEETTLPNLEYALASYYVIATAEASSNLARFDGVRYGYTRPSRAAGWESAFTQTRSNGFGAEVKRRILLGTYVLSAGYFDQYYLRAQRARGLLRGDFERAFKNFDALIGPTMPNLPPLLEEEVEPLEMYSMDVNTVPANLTGLPALSVPCGRRKDLPVGMQIYSPMFKDEVALRLGHAYEEEAK